MSAVSNEREPLGRDAIVARAIAIADDRGVDGLSMRSLARELGYEVMSLYNHVANKDEVLSLMVDGVAAEIPTSARTPARTPTDADDPLADHPLADDPLAAARALAVDTRAALVRHPWAAALWLSQMPGPARMRHMEYLLAALAATDMALEVAHLAFHAVNNHVIGYTLQEQAMSFALPAGGDADALARQFLDGIDPDEFPNTVTHVRQHLEGETGSSFEIVLDLILDGLSRLGRADA